MILHHGVNTGGLGYEVFGFSGGNYAIAPTTRANSCCFVFAFGVRVGSASTTE
jgi:hypothetical protein